MRHTWLATASVALALLATLQNVDAQSTFDSQRVAVLYQHLASPTMNEAYGAAYGGTYQFTPSGQDQYFGERLRFSGEIGLIGGGGDPLITDATWVVTSSELAMAVIPLGVTGTYTVLGSESGSLSSCLGLGAIGFLGAERLAIEAEGGNLGGFDWHDTLLRASIAGQAMASARGQIGGHVSFVAEVSWLQGGKGSRRKSSFSEKEIAEGWNEVGRVFQHPDFSFTGLRASIGVQW